MSFGCRVAVKKGSHPFMNIDHETSTSEGGSSGGGEDMKRGECGCHG
jgi:hypothetical protein